MVYEIAGLRVLILNEYYYTSGLCKEYRSFDQNAKVDLIAKVSEEEFLAEKTSSPQYSDGYLENICLYRNICLQLPVLNRMLLHASVLSFRGNGYAFLGRSGTGKTTHSKLWLQYLPNVKIVNGDKPILYDNGKEFIAYGTPWRGKEGLGQNTWAPLKGLCFIEQAKENAVRKLTPSEVTFRIFGQLLLPQEERNAAACLELADKLITRVPAYLLQCDMSEGAVQTSFEALTGLSFSENKLQ